MVRRSVGGATPPSVMALFGLHQLGMIVDIRVSKWEQFPLNRQKRLSRAFALRVAMVFCTKEVMGSFKHTIIVERIKYLTIVLV